MEHNIFAKDIDFIIKYVRAFFVEVHDINSLENIDTFIAQIKRISCFRIKDIILNNVLFVENR